jgi:RHS repeat-associated protein
VGNLITLIYPDGKQVHYEYNSANQLITVTDWAERETLYTYDPNGRLISTERPNGTQMTRVYNEAGQLKQQKDVVVATGEIISQFDFKYDAAGNIIEEKTNFEPDPEINLEMTYQAANRLATIDDQIVQFDADGNLTKGPLSGELVNFEFDSRNHLTQAGSTVYRYDAENQRIGVNQTSYVVNSQPALSQVLVRTKGNGEVTYYVYGLGLIGEANAGNYFSYHYDRRGSTVALTDESGQVTERFLYSPYGLLLSGDTTKTPFLFNGMYGVMTDDNGLYYMRARFYSPEIRRFINQDVLLGNISQGQTLNRYAFVTGNPITFVDPFGLNSENATHAEKITLVMAISSFFIPGPGELLDIDALFGVTQPTTGWEKLGAGSSLVLSVLTLGTSPNFGSVLKCADEISKVANKFGVFQCEECAEAIIKILQKHKIENGKVIEFHAPGNTNIWHDGLGQNISTNGRHVAVEVDGIIYDNIHKNGIPRAEWEKQFVSIYGGFETFEVVESPFSDWLEKLHELRKLLDEE